tara:strand:+ start:211 stop:951 length:741 start_codon:yes stop_codon:yes gene_type:complete
MAMLDSDLLLVGRGGGSFRTTAQELKTYVEAGDGLTFRGSVDLTAAPVIDPNPPAVGDLYINTTAGTVNAGWTGAAGSATGVGDRVLWDGSEWDLVTQTQDVGVTDVNVTAPITDTGTAAQPNIGISDATNAAKGAVQLALGTYEGDGTLLTTNDEDVLIKTHFNELAGRITAASGGGVQSIVGSNGLTASGTSTVTVAGIDAAVGTVGVVALSDTVADVSTTAATPAAINNYAVPLNISNLPELT